MSAKLSELVEISKLNGDFKKNYGRLIGGYLYLRSIGPLVQQETPASADKAKVGVRAARCVSL
jgi:hypothetical protein